MLCCLGRWFAKTTATFHHRCFHYCLQSLLHLYFVLMLHLVLLSYCYVLLYTRKSVAHVVRKALTDSQLMTVHIQANTIYIYIYGHISVDELEAMYLRSLQGECVQNSPKGSIPQLLSTVWLRTVFVFPSQTSVQLIQVLPSVHCFLIHQPSNKSHV